MLSVYTKLMLCTLITHTKPLLRMLATRMSARVRLSASWPCTHLTMEQIPSFRSTGTSHGPILLPTSPRSLRGET